MCSGIDSRRVIFEGNDVSSVKRCPCEAPTSNLVGDWATSTINSMGSNISVVDEACTVRSEGQGDLSVCVDSGSSGGHSKDICPSVTVILPQERTSRSETSENSIDGVDASVLFPQGRVDDAGQWSPSLRPFGSTGLGKSGTKTVGLSSSRSVGAAATVLGTSAIGSFNQSTTLFSFGDTRDHDQFHLPHSVLQVIATSLQCDLLVAATLQHPLRLAETVLCVPRGLITVPLRFSKSALAASERCEVLSTDALLLPSMLTAVLGARPKRFLATHFDAEGYEGICYSLWLDPAKVPDVAETVMAEAGLSLPLLLASSVRALCCDRMGRRFDVIMKKMPQAVMFVDDGRSQCLVNPSAAELLGLPGPGEYHTRKVATGMQLLADRSVAAADVYRCICMLAGKPDQTRDWHWELKHPRSVLRVRSYPVSNVATHGRVWLFDDVTSERDAHDAIEEANMAKSKFLAMMSHELRTPMTGVLGMLDLLRLTSLTEEQARFMKVMQGSAEGLLQVLNEILDFSKIQSGHLALENVNFQIDTLLEQVSTLFQGRLAEKSLSLEVEMPSNSDVLVYGDPNRLRQVLSNLVSNAIKFTEEGSIRIKGKWVLPHADSGNPELHDPYRRVCGNSSLRSSPDGFEHRYGSSPSSCRELDPSILFDGDVTAEELSEYQSSFSCHDLPESDESGRLFHLPETAIWFEIEVSDTGIGLSLEQRSRLFQSFSQADRSTTRKFGGTGLGLAICKGLVEVMGGNIWVESELGKGSTFGFRVPLHAVPIVSDLMPSIQRQSSLTAVKKSHPSCLRPKASGLKILVAEDNTVNQLLIQKMLQHYGHEVELVVNGQLAVEAMQSRQLDVILMDLQMPVLDGLTATKKIRGLGGLASQIPIYALTADVLTAGTESLEAMGLTGYLTKPINWDVLSRVLDEVTEMKAAERSWISV